MDGTEFAYALPAMGEQPGVAPLQAAFEGAMSRILMPPAKSSQAFPWTIPVIIPGS